MHTRYALRAAWSVRRIYRYAVHQHTQVDDSKKCPAAPVLISYLVPGTGVDSRYVPRYRESKQYWYHLPVCYHMILTGVVHTQASRYLSYTYAFKRQKAEHTITGDHSKQDQILLVKIVKYTVFSVCLRSYLLWSPVILIS